MAKLITPFDTSLYSQLNNAFGTKIAQAVREIGAVEYDNTLTIKTTGDKVITPFDYASYSKIVDIAGLNPTYSDMRGTDEEGINREIGALEYDSTLDFSNSPKLVSVYDYAEYSSIVNYTVESSIKYLPTYKDIRGITAPFNAGSERISSSSLPQTPTYKDIRSVAQIGSIREIGAIEYDNTLAITNEFPSLTEISNAIWTTPKSNLINSINTAGSILASLVIDTGNAQLGTSSTITLTQASSTNNDFYNEQLVAIISGQGVGQIRTISDYVGSTRTASVGSNWTIAPNSSSVYAILPFSISKKDIWTASKTIDYGSNTMGETLKNTELLSDDAVAIGLSK